MHIYYINHRLLHGEHLTINQRLSQIKSYPSQYDAIVLENLTMGECKYFHK